MPPIERVSAPMKGFALSIGSERFTGTTFYVEPMLIWWMRSAGFGLLGCSASREFGLTLVTDSAALGDQAQSLEARSRALRGIWA